MYSLTLVGALALIVFILFLSAAARYKKCPSNKVLVKYGNVGKDKSALPIHGGATFVWPLVQAYEFLDLTPMTTDINLTKALSNQNIRIDIPSRFTFGISTKPTIMINAAERLLGLKPSQIEELARDIIFGQLRATVATMEIESINADREAFEKKVMDNVESELNKIGLYLINVNFTDINDESGYIEALGKKAAAEAINKAKIEVAKQERDGETGKANADQEKRVNVAKAEAEAVKGENLAEIQKANSHADRRENVADAEKRAISAEKIKAAEALEASYKSEQKAESERKKKEQITQEIHVVVPADVERQKIEKAAEAEKARLTREGEGKGLAIQKEMEGQAAGILAVLQKKAEGLKEIVKAAGGNPDKAATLLIVEQLPAIVEAQTKAISSIKFDKVVVMDGMGGPNGTSTTASWLSSVVKALPGLQEFAEMSGIKLPAILGDTIEAEFRKKAEETAPSEKDPKKEPEDKDAK
ncbi:flotillin family protein [bacterium]|nr:flotillin family protein [bacterium]